MCRFNSGAPPKKMVREVGLTPRTEATTLCSWRTVVPLETETVRVLPKVG